MRRVFSVLVGIVSACFAMYFFSCSPRQALKFKIPGAALSVSKTSFAVGHTWVQAKGLQAILER
jgi:hypothetical protein